jgi:subtilisin family serine protease
VQVDGIPIGLRFTAADDPELTGCTLDRVNGVLDRCAGHGTFIAGVVRQHCPESTLLVVPVMYGDGVADEAFLVETLQLLWIRQLLVQRGRHEGPSIDVLSLSLGYYHETPGAFDDEPAFVAVLRALAGTGVAITAAAGNGGTDHPFYPAAFALADDFDVPLTSVGAQNPDGRTVAVFSNTGVWVRAYRRGTAVVSTMPVTFDGSLRGTLYHHPTPNPPRGASKPDHYCGGFGLWSGTSFSAPALAGEVAAHLVAARAEKELQDPGARCKRLAEVVAEVVGGER